MSTSVSWIFFGIIWQVKETYYENNQINFQY